MEAVLRVALLAALAVALVYAYAALALVARGRLASRAPPRTIWEALVVGALVPACGCTALPYARRCVGGTRATFVTAAYAANPLLVVAAFVLAGPLAALVVLALALVAAWIHASFAGGEAARDRLRLDDLLLRRGASPWRDAVPYGREFAIPAFAAGGLVGVVSFAPPLAVAVAFVVLGAVMAPPHAELVHDHGAAFARRTRVIHLAFAVGAALAVGVLA